MCGIAGIIGRDRERIHSASLQMTNALLHRGPDQHGLEIHRFGDSWLGLGHRRLSFLDLSDLGRQPMVHEPSGCRITYNGEVYNFKILRKELEERGEHFKSGSDTEVILAGIARDGPTFIERLEGMYAFGLFDPRNTTLILVRDPAGIKPLYIAEADGCFLFASEVRALLASGIVSRKISKAAVGSLLAFGSVQQPLSIFESVRMSPPGSWQTIRAKCNEWIVDTPQVWWNPPSPKLGLSQEEIVSQTRKHLVDAVDDHLISDVPVGVFLSAGIDSTIIAGLAARSNQKIRAFTVGFADQPEIDESVIAAQTAKRLGLSHTSISISASEAESTAAEWFAVADQPSMDGLNTFIISKAVKAQGVKAALAGLGADELFGGYSSFRDVPKLLSLSKAVSWLPRSARRGVAGMLTATKSSLIRQKLIDMLGGPGTVARLALHRRRVLSDGQLKKLGLIANDYGLTQDWIPPDAVNWLPHEGCDIGWAVSVVESRFYQTNVLLRDSDANGMAHALEIRVPFLDQRLLNFANSLLDKTRFPQNQQSKYLLHQAARELLPFDLINRPKTGFVIPMFRWMSGPMRLMCERGLSSLKETGLVRPLEIDHIWNSFLNTPNSPIWSRALTLVALGDYISRHGNC